MGMTPPFMIYTIRERSEQWRDRSYVTHQNCEGKGSNKEAMIEGFNEPVYYGVHGGIKRFYQVEPEKEHAAT